MNDLRPLSEWVVREQLPVLMVVMGCINHALLLTAQAVANDELPMVAGWRIVTNHGGALC